MICFGYTIPICVICINLSFSVMPEVGPAGQVARRRVDFDKLGWKLKRFQSIG